MKLYIRACWHTDFHKLGSSLENFVCVWESPFTAEKRREGEAGGLYLRQAQKGLPS